MTKAGKYIDRAALFNSLANVKTIGEVFAAIQDAPAEGVEKVVRCRECKYRKNEQPGMVYCPHMIGGWVAENWFCAGGEKE